MAENYKELYHWAKHMLDRYQDEIVPGLREQLEKRVEVVRCEDCIKKKAGDVWNMCYVWETGVPNDGFCFKGERKDNATD